MFFYSIYMKRNNDNSVFYFLLCMCKKKLWCIFSLCLYRFIIYRNVSYWHIRYYSLFFFWFIYHYSQIQSIYISLIFRFFSFHLSLITNPVYTYFSFIFRFSSFYYFSFFDVCDFYFYVHEKSVLEYFIPSFDSLRLLFFWFIFPCFVSFYSVRFSSLFLVLPSKKLDLVAYFDFRSL